MRFMVMHKMTAELDAQLNEGLPPDPEIIKGVGQLIGEGAKQKVFQDGAGLRGSSQRSFIKYAGGQRTIVDGPFTDPKELVGGFALMKVKSKDEAIAWCDRFAAAIGDIELFLGAVMEPWDLGVVPKPAHAPLRFLAMHRLDEAKAATAPSPETMQKMGALIDEMTKAGVLQSTAGLGPTKDGARIRFEGGRRTVQDGPFTESKELVAGYSILELPSKAAAIEWGLRFGEIVRVNEVEIRPLPEG